MGVSPLAPKTPVPRVVAHVRVRCEQAVSGGHEIVQCEMRWGTSVRCAHPISHIRQPSSVGREPVIPVRSQLSHGCAKDVHGVMGTRSR